MIDEVCDIIGHHHHPREVETVNFKCLYDADLLVNLEESHPDRAIAQERLEQILNKSFFTDSGKRLAVQVLGSVRE